MISNLSLKLSGKLPIDKDELCELVDSWGRFDNFEENYYKIKECYDLSNLDVSQITDLSDIFFKSFYNGDLSKWNTSNVENMESMFSYSKFNNNSLKNWNISNVKNMKFMFKYSIFNGDISKWYISNCLNFSCMFYKGKFNGDISNWKFNINSSVFLIFSDNKNFMNKYNDGNTIPSFKDINFFNWFEDNRLNIANANISKNELNDINNYLNNFDKDKELQL